MKATREPAWTWCLAGAILALGWWESRPAKAPEVTAAERRRWRPEDDPVRMSARELRGLPGLGTQRSLAAVEARWRHGPGVPGLAWSDVPGIGPVTEARVRAWLAARGAPGLELTRSGPPAAPSATKAPCTVAP